MQTRNYVHYDTGDKRDFKSCRVQVVSTLLAFSLGRAVVQAQRNAATIIDDIDKKILWLSLQTLPESGDS